MFSYFVRVYSSVSVYPRWVSEILKHPPAAVKLPMLLAHTNINDDSLNILIEHLTDFLAYVYWQLRPGR
jgi:hypothetical protein